MTTIVIPQTVYAAIRAHGEECYPHESCGALLGQSINGNWQIIDSIQATNTQQHNRYTIAPQELIAIERQARSRNLAIAGFYHSHPDHPAQPSPTDLAEAHWSGCAYVITEVAHGKAAATNAFLLAGTAKTDKHFELLTIQVEN